MEDLERDISSKKHKSNPFLCKYVDLTTSDLSINQLDIYGANVQGVTSNLLVRAEIVGEVPSFVYPHIERFILDSFDCHFRRPVGLSESISI